MKGEVCPEMTIPAFLYILPPLFPSLVYLSILPKRTGFHYVLALAKIQVKLSVHTNKPDGFKIITYSMWYIDYSV